MGKGKHLRALFLIGFFFPVLPHLFHGVHGQEPLEVLNVAHEGAWILIPVTVQGTTKSWILDSGASTSVLDSTYAAALGVEWGDPIRITGATGSTMASTLQLPPLQVGGLSFQGGRTVALNLGPVVRDRLGLEVAGILGRDFLRHYVTRIDYAGERVSFYDPESFTYGGSGEIYSGTLRDGTFGIPITVDGRHRGVWAVDTGAGGLSFHYPYAEAQGLTELEGARYEGHDAAGPSERKTLRFSSITVAGVTFPDPLIDVPLQSAGAFGRDRYQGNAGSYLFKYFVLYLDYAGDRVILEPGTLCCRKTPDLVHGLGARLEEGGTLVIRQILAGSSAQESGLRVGDTLLTLGDIRLEGHDGLERLREDLRAGPAGSKRWITIRREGGIRTLKLTLEDYFRRGG